MRATVCNWTREQHSYCNVVVITVVVTASTAILTGVCHACMWPAAAVSALISSAVPAGLLLHSTALTDELGLEDSTNCGARDCSIWVRGWLVVCVCMHTCMHVCVCFQLCTQASVVCVPPGK